MPYIIYNYVNFFIYNKIEIIKSKNKQNKISTI